MVESSHNRRIARGIGWMLLFKLIERSLGILSTLVLVRLLSPADFGVVAMAQSVIVMVQLLAAFGFDVALIHDQSATEEHYHTAWTLNACVGALITVVVVALAGPIARFYGKPELFWVVCALASSSLFSGLENIGIVAFRKELRFRSEFVFQVSRKLIAISVTLPLAFAFRSYWALVAGTVTSAFAGMVITYVAHPFRPRFSVSRAAELMHFSRWLLIGNVIAFVKERSSDFFIGRLAGPSALGAYNVSYEISNLPTTELSAPINRALMPGFSSLAGSPVAVRETYLHAFSLLAMLAVPAAVGILALADFLVPVLLGDRWHDAVPLIRILAMCGLLLTLQSSSATALIGTGHPRIASTTNAIHAGVLLVCLVLLVPSRGAVGAAIATGAAALAATPVFLINLRRHVGVSLMAMLHRFWRPSASAAVMLAAVWGLLPAHTPDMTLITSAGYLAAGALLGGGTYVVSVFVIWALVGKPPGAERLMLGQLQAMAARRATARNPQPEPRPNDGA